MAGKICKNGILTHYLRFDKSVVKSFPPVLQYAPEYYTLSIHGAFLPFQNALRTEIISLSKIFKIRRRILIDRDNIAKNVALLTLFRSDIKNWQTNESTREYFYEQPKRKYFPILQYYIFSLIVKMH